MSDALECADKLLGGIYPASLLYFVSAMCEETEVDMPLIGMQRYFTNSSVYPDSDPIIHAVRQFHHSVADTMVWSPQDNGPGLASEAARHQDFDDGDTKTMGSVSYLIHNWSV
jgi:hypothetical protein